MEYNMEDFSKNKTRTTLWSSYPSSGYLSKDYKNTDLKRYMLLYVYYGIYNSQDMKAT